MENNITTLLSMKEEARKRMEILGLSEEIINKFFENGTLCCSDKTQITIVPPRIMKEIERWQGIFHNCVYHVVHSEYYGETYECLFVSCHKDDWIFESSIVRDNWAMSRSIAVKAPAVTESGAIKVKNIHGVLLRIQ